jgi:hypothetical protein
VTTYWLGGGTGGGKTTVARALAARYALRRFSLDAFWYAYADDEPAKSPDEQWLETAPEAQALEFEDVSRRMHRRALAEVGGIPTLVEGPQVQPDLIPPGDRVVFLVPTPEFQRSVLEPRPMPSSDPRRALQNRLIKDRIYADRIAARARDQGFPVIDVDGTRDLVDEVSELLQIEAEPIDLAAAWRWENEVTAQNRREWLASGDRRVSEESAFTWVCECGERGCDATFRLTLDEYEAGAVRSAH